MIDRLLAVLGAVRVTAPDEYTLQRAIAVALVVAGIHHTAEEVLSRGERIDFLVPGDVSVGIEVKVKGSAGDVARQCLRYLRSSRIDALVVVSAKAALVRNLPEVVAIGGRDKRIYTVETWRGAL